MASPLIVSGRAFYRGLSGGVALTRTGFVDERRLVGGKPEMQVDTVEREKKRERDNMICMGGPLRDLI